MILGVEYFLSLFAIVIWVDRVIRKSTADASACSERTSLFSLFKLYYRGPDGAHLGQFPWCDDAGHGLKPGTGTKGFSSFGGGFELVGRKALGLGFASSAAGIVAAFVGSAATLMLTNGFSGVFRIGNKLS